MVKNSTLLKAVILHFLFFVFVSKSIAQTIHAVGKSNTLELANWNLEWFGKTSSGFGPDNDTLQQALVKRVIESSDIDVWAFCEVSEPKAFDSMMKKLPAYSYVVSPYFPEQKTAFIFKKEMFELHSSGLLAVQQKDSFSTLRFPFEIKLIPKSDIGIDTLIAIALHLKANTGNDSLKMLAYNSRKRSSEWLRMYLDKLKLKSYCIVLGDWNDDLDKSIYNALPSPFANLQTVQYPYTFVSRRLTDLDIGTTTSYPNAIDHQLVSKSLLEKHIKDACTVWKLDTSISNYSQTCSDHYPVYSYYNMYSSSLDPTKVSLPVIAFPNPANSNFSLLYCPKNSGIVILNSEGKTVYQTNVFFNESIDTNAWSNGIYCVILKTEYGNSYLYLQILH